ncbi:MAG: CopG family transcriptional regulator, partial [Mycobacteriales bacterium]
MVRTTVFLSEQQRQRIKQLARRRGSSEAEVIRSAIDRELAELGVKQDIMPVLHSGNPVIDDEAALIREG